MEKSEESKKAGEEKISTGKIEKIADLAMIELNEKEKKELGADLSNIIDFADALLSVDTENVEPMMHILPVNNVLREDEVKESFDREDLLKNAKTKEKGCFYVPKII